MLRSYSTTAASRRRPLVAFLYPLDIVALNTYNISKAMVFPCLAKTDVNFQSSLEEELRVPERSCRNAKPYLLRLKRVYAAGDEDLPPN